MAFLAQMKQSNKCGSVRNDEIIILHLHQPHLLIPSTQNNQPEKNKKTRNKIELPTNHNSSRYPQNKKNPKNIPKFITNVAQWSM